MSHVTAFALSFGSFLALMALISAWVFRTSTAPLWMKLIVPALTVGAACGAPFAVNSMLGLPVVTTEAALPDHVKLVAFVPHDEAKTVDIWLVFDDLPRAYQVPLTSGMKSTLRAAAPDLAQGKPVYLRKKKHGEAKGNAKGTAGDGESVTNFAEDYDSGFVLDLAVGLPQKN